jgi:hypothetical protein
MPVCAVSANASAGNYKRNANHESDGTGPAVGAEDTCCGPRCTGLEEGIAWSRGDGDDHVTVCDTPEHWRNTTVDPNACRCTVRSWSSRETRA